MLIPSLTTTSPLPAISDRTSTSGFLVALNELLGGDSNEGIQGKRNIREKSPADAARQDFFRVRQNGDSTREGIVFNIIGLSFVYLMCMFSHFCVFFLIFVLSMHFVELSHASHS